MLIFIRINMPFFTKKSAYGKNISVYSTNTIDPYTEKFVNFYEIFSSCSSACAWLTVGCTHTLYTKIENRDTTAQQCGVRYSVLTFNVCTYCNVYTTSTMYVCMCLCIFHISDIFNKKMNLYMSAKYTINIDKATEMFVVVRANTRNLLKNQFLNLLTNPASKFSH